MTLTNIAAWLILVAAVYRLHQLGLLLLTKTGAQSTIPFISLILEILVLFVFDTRDAWRQARKNHE